MISSLHPPSPAARANPGWRVLGVLIIVDQVLTYLGPVIDPGAPIIGAGRDEVEAQFVSVPFITKALGSYVELVGVVVFLSWVVLASQLMRGDGPRGGWLSTMIRAAAVLACSATIPALAVQVAATYEGHRDTPWQWLGVVNDVAVASYLAALAIRGAIVVGLAVAGLRSARLPRWLGWSGIVLGGLGFVSPLGAGAGLHQLVFLAISVWMIALAVIALVRRTPPSRAVPVEIVPTEIVPTEIVTG